MGVRTSIVLDGAAKSIRWKYLLYLELLVLDKNRISILIDN